MLIKFMASFGVGSFLVFIAILSIFALTEYVLSTDLFITCCIILATGTFVSKLLLFD